MVGKHCTMNLQPQLEINIFRSGLGTSFLLTGPLTLFLDPFRLYPVATVGTLGHQLWSGMIHCGDRPLEELTTALIILSSPLWESSLSLWIPFSLPSWVWWHSDPYEHRICDQTQCIQKWMRRKRWFLQQGIQDFRFLLASGGNCYYCFVHYHSPKVTLLLRHQPSVQAVGQKITMNPLWEIIKGQGSKSDFGLLCFTGASMIGVKGSHSSDSSRKYTAIAKEAGWK